mgnify:CR=1 FL=1
MGIDLEKITFGKGIEEDLKQKIKKDVSKFELCLFENKISAHLYLQSKKMITLNCDRIFSFKFPKKSQEQSLRNEGISVEKYRAITLMFSYNNKRYFINGYI